MKMKKIILLVSFTNLLIMAGFAQQLNVNWTVSGGGTGQEYMKQICETTDNNYVAAGNFTGAFISEGITYNSILNGTDIFIVKYDQNNSIMWTKVFGNACNENVTGIASDALGNIYITGSFYSSLSIDNNTIFSAGSQDGFIASLDINGNLNWLQAFGSTGSDEGTSVKVSADGKVVIAASMNNTTFALNDQPSTGNSASIACMTSQGTVIWSICESAVASGDIDITDLVLDNAGNVFVTGSFNGNIAAGDNGTVSMQSVSTKLFIASYTSAGNTNYIYTPAQSTSATSAGTGIVLNNFNHAVICGYTTGNITIGPATYSSNDRDVIVAALDENGLPVWSDVIVASNFQLAQSIGFSNDVLAIGGYFLDDFNTGNTMLNFQDGSDAFVITYENNLLESASSFSGIGDENIKSVTKINSQLCIAGDFSQDLMTGTNTLQTAGASDYFISAVTPQQTTGIAENSKASSAVVAYPNPAVDFVNFKFDSSSEMVLVTLYSADGRKVLKNEFSSAMNSDLGVDISELPVGIYTVTIQDGISVINSMFVKQ